MSYVILFHFLASYRRPTFQLNLSSRRASDRARNHGFVTQITCVAAIELWYVPRRRRVGKYFEFPTPKIASAVVISELLAAEDRAIAIDLLLDAMEKVLYLVPPRLQRTPGQFDMPRPRMREWNATRFERLLDASRRDPAARFRREC